jgi:sugar (pentulose or hexulose) kinase
VNDGYLLAIDVGTGSARAVLFTSSGHQAGIGQREYSHLALPTASHRQTPFVTARLPHSANTTS